MGLLEGAVQGGGVLVWALPLDVTKQALLCAANTYVCGKVVCFIPYH